MAGDELLARIAKSPDDDGAYLVYADFLTSKGDPHGELIVLMHQLQTSTDEQQRAYLGNALDAYQTKHRSKLFGELGKHQGIGWDFHLGFLRGVHYLPDTSDEEDKVVEQILKLPIARFLRELLVFEQWEQNHAKIRKVVEKHKPATLDAVELVKKYESLEEAMDAGDAVKWLDVDATAEREPAAISKLANIEWLEIGGQVRSLSADLAKLTKLHRLDIDWSGVRAIADEVFGIESLSYISMYDCELPKTYHMGRMNSLLFGFSRARTPSRRRVIELNLLLGNDAKAKKLASKADLLAALDNNVGVVREGALRLLGNVIEKPKSLPANATFALLGKTNMDKKQIASLLGGRKLSPKIDDETTHVILGLEPGGRQAAIGDRVIVLDAHLKTLVAGKPAKAAAKSSAAVVDGLRSGNEKATAKAVAAIDPFDPALLVDLVVVLSDTKLGKSREAAKKLVALHAPAVKAAFDAHLKSSVLAGGMGETKRTSRITAFAKQAKLDGLELAMRLIERDRVGLGYVIEHGKPADIARALELIAAGKGGKKLDLAAKELSELPAEIAKLATVEELDLNSNHFTQFPEPVLAMKSLVSLELANNRITKIPDAITKLKLEKLDIGGNRWRKFPTAVLGLTSLEDLGLYNSQDYVENEARITGLPDGIGKLTKLKRFSYQFNIIEKFPDVFWKLPLEELDLGWCTLPAELPPQLASLKKLEKLTVWYSNWADKKKDLKKLLPKCKIEA